MSIDKAETIFAIRLSSEGLKFNTSTYMAFCVSHFWKKYQMPSSSHIEKCKLLLIYMQTYDQNYFNSFFPRSNKICLIESRAQF